MESFVRVLGWTVGIGVACFAIGFLGPMLLAPGANQGPLLGIFITGPLGLMAGFVMGVWKEYQRPGSGVPLWPIRVVVAIGGALLFLYGLTGVMRGEDVRGSAAAMVLAVAVLWFAILEDMPRWFGR